jgi:DNA-binding IclR family transcriptional regulator
VQFHSLKSSAKASERATTHSSALRAFAVLESVASADVPPTLDEVTRTSGLPKPTVFRILALLARGGFVQREALGKRYAVGPRMSALSLQVQRTSPLRSQRRAVLERLVAKIRETCNFTVLDRNEVVYLDRVETQANVRLHMEIGSRVPLHCTASGKLFLAHLPETELRKLLGPGPYRRYTPRTSVALDDLARELRRIRASGISTDVGEYLEGSVCLAVPVRDAKNRVSAAVAVHGPAPRMTLKKGQSFLPALHEAAAAIAATLSPAGPDRSQ